MCYENRTARLGKLKLRSFEGFAEWTRKPTVLEGNLRRLKAQRRNPTLKIFHVCIYFLNQPASYDFGYVERPLTSVNSYVYVTEMVVLFCLSFRSKLKTKCKTNGSIVFLGIM
jgi:hypothetical protein